MSYFVKKLDTNICFFLFQSIKFTNIVLKILLKYSIKHLTITFILLSFFLNKANCSLSAITSMTIQGYSPRLTPQIEEEINNEKEFNFFGVEYLNKKYYDNSLLKEALTPYILKKTPNDLDLNWVIRDPNSSEYIDSDGDAPAFFINENKDSVVLDWYYKDSSGIENKLDSTEKNKTFEDLLLEGKNSFFVKIIGSVILKTKYGDPNAQVYPDNNINVTKKPYRNFNIVVYNNYKIKSASPDMQYSATIYDPKDSTKFDSKDKNGFLPQENYQDNFPSTGANNLQFYIVTNNIDNSSNTTHWNVKTSNPNDSEPGAITAKIEKTKVNGAYFKKYDEKNMVLVTLSGPDIKDKNNYNKKIPTAKLPVDIELFAITDSGKRISYKFRITKWFVNRGSVIDKLEKQIKWCSGLGEYKLPKIEEITNSIRLKSNFYKRVVNKGLLAEWGKMANYPSANFYNLNYSFAEDESTNHYTFNMNDGAQYLWDNSRNESRYVICVSK